MGTKEVGPGERTRLSPLDKLHGVDLMDKTHAAVLQLNRGFDPDTYAGGGDFEGVNSPQAYLARKVLFSKRLTTGLLDGLNHKDTREPLRSLLVGVAEKPEALVQELEDSVGGKVGPFPAHPIAALRLAKIMTSDEGRGVYKGMVSNPGGNKAVASFFNNPAASVVLLRTLAMRDQEFAVELMQDKVAGQQKLEKYSVRQFHNAPAPVDRQNIKDELGDADIRQLLRGDVRNSFETMVEFFSTAEKHQRFLRFISDKRNMKAVSGLLSANPAWTSWAFSHVIKEEGGRQRLADTICDPDGNKIICRLMRTAEGQEAMFDTLHGGDPDDPADRPGIDVASRILTHERRVPAVFNLVTSLAMGRRFGMRKGLGDMPTTKVDAVVSALSP